MKIYNMPAYATEYPYIVVTVEEDYIWFYGAYSTRVKAVEVALEIGGCVLPTTNVEAA